MNTKLLKEIRAWIKDFEATQPRNVIIDVDDQSFEGTAYYLFKMVLKENSKLKQK